MNKFAVILKNGHVCAANLLSGRLLTPEEAIGLAAHLVKKAILLGPVTKEDFEKLMENDK